MMFKSSTKFILTSHGLHLFCVFYSGDWQHMGRVGIPGTTRYAAHEKGLKGEKYTADVLRGYAQALQPASIPTRRYTTYTVPYGMCSKYVEPEENISLSKSNPTNIDPTQPNIHTNLTNFICVLIVRL